MKILVEYSAVPGEKNKVHTNDMSEFIAWLRKKHYVTVSFTENVHKPPPAPQGLQYIEFPSDANVLNTYDLVILLGGNTPDLHMALKDKFQAIRGSMCTFWGISAGAIVLTHLGACTVKNGDTYNKEDGDGGQASDYYYNEKIRKGPFFNGKMYIPHMNTDGSYTKDGKNKWPQYEYLTPEEKKELRPVYIQNNVKPITVTIAS